MAIETLYDRMGGMGRFQVMTSLCITLCQVPVGWSMLQMTFAGVMPDFNCLVRDDGDSFAGSRRDDTRGYETGTSVHHPNQTLNECSVNGTRCVRYIYETSAETVIKEFGLVCGLKWTKKVIISIQMAGVLIGAVFAGQFSDVFGRKKVMYSFAFVHTVLNVICGFSVNWVMFATLRFFIGLCIGGIIVIATPFIMEFLPVKWRALAGVLPSFSLGIAIFAGAAALLENWSHLHFACAALCLVVFLCGWFVPESPRWLAVRGREKEAGRVINRIARMNRKPVPEETHVILMSMKVKTEENKDTLHKFTYVDLFKTKFTIKLSAIFFYYWFILAIVYYGIYFGVGSFVGNLYLNIFLLGIIDMPVQLSSFFLNNGIGRRKTTLAFLSFSLVSLFGCLLFHEVSEGNVEATAINVLSLVAIVMTGVAWTSIQIWGTELFPTVVRNLGCGFSSFGARVGGILAPFVIDFDDNMSLSYLILSVMLGVGIVVTFTLPETSGKVLNDHVQDRAISLINTEDTKIDKLEEIQSEHSNSNDIKEKDAFITNSDKYNM